MENILKYLKDPAWWFTAVFIAILVSIISTLLNNYITNLFSHLSSSRRERREKAKINLEKEIDFLSKDPHLITFTYIRGVTILLFAAIFFISFVLFFIGHTIILFFIEHVVTLDVKLSLQLIGKYIFLVLSLMNGIMVIPSFTIGTRLFDKGKRAARKYRKNLLAKSQQS